MSTRKNALSSPSGIHPNTETASRQMNLIVTRVSSFDDRNKLRKSDTAADTAVTRTTPRIYLSYKNASAPQAAWRLGLLADSSLILHPMADKTPMTVPSRGLRPFASAL